MRRTFDLFFVPSRKLLLRNAAGEAGRACEGGAERSQRQSDFWVLHRPLGRPFGAAPSPPRASLLHAYGFGLPSPPPSTPTPTPHLFLVCFHVLYPRSGCGAVEDDALAPSASLRACVRPLSRLFAGSRAGAQRKVVSNKPATCGGSFPSKLLPGSGNHAWSTPCSQDKSLADILSPPPRPPPPLPL